MSDREEYHYRMVRKSCEDCDQVQIVKENEMLEPIDMLEILQNYLNIDYTKIHYRYHESDIDALISMQELLNKTDLVELKNRIIMARVANKL